MKKKLFTAILTAALCLTSMIETDPIAANAIAVNENLVKETSVTQKTDLSNNSTPFLSKKGKTKSRTAQVQSKLRAAWDSVSKSCDLSSFKLKPSELFKIFYDTQKQYPQYFYVDYYSSPTNLKTDAGYETNIDLVYITTDKTKINRMRTKYNQAVSKFKKNVSKSWSDIEKVLYINDYLALNCAFKSNLKGKYIHTAYGALVDRKAVCDGYSYAFKELASQIGLSSEIVSSESLDHAWNLVKVNGKYYHTDVTWNDPQEDTIGWAGHDYLLKSTAYLKSYLKDTEYAHFKKSDWEITGGLSPRAASSKTYDNYFWDTVDSGFFYIDKAWYGFDGKDSINQYTCDGKHFKKVKDIVQIDDEWYIDDETSPGISCLNGKLFYAKADRIYKMNLTTGNTKLVFQLPRSQKKEGHLYKIYITPSKKLQYWLTFDPVENGKVYTVKNF